MSEYTCKICGAYDAPDGQHHSRHTRGCVGLLQRAERAEDRIRMARALLRNYKGPLSAQLTEALEDRE